MYFTSLPDHSDPAFDEETHFGRFGTTNIVFNAQSNGARCDNHVGCFSVKTVLRGEEWYGLDGRKVAVRPGQFLILNDGQRYSCWIEGKPVRTVSIFFAKEFVKLALQDLRNTEEESVDDPFGSGCDIPEFYQSLHSFDYPLQHRLRGLISSLDAEGYVSGMVDERLMPLLSSLISVHRNDVTLSKKVHGVKSSTQKEIFKRVSIARDTLHSCYREKPDLKFVGAISCLSVPQLVRQFRAVFGTSPHQYLNAIRLQNAFQLLQSTDLSVADIALDCGFDNANAFCRAFKSRYGMNSSRVRRRR
ncbi:MAG TPA: AraC family transcriptional regulator [Cyclobacteriaceae bacterium]|nr:AraC family transcriptional regulator [Cyclobacteriaceae bacterium]